MTGSMSCVLLEETRRCFLEIKKELESYQEND